MFRIQCASYQIFGDFVLIDESNEAVFAFRRSNGSVSALLVLNFTSQDVHFCVPKETLRSLGGSRRKSDKWKLVPVLSNYTSSLDDEIETITVDNLKEDRIYLKLRGYEGRIYLSL